SFTVASAELKLPIVSNRRGRHRIQRHVGGFGRDGHLILRNACWFLEVQTDGRGLRDPDSSRFTTHGALVNYGPRLWGTRGCRRGGMTRCSIGAWLRR